MEWPPPGARRGQTWRRLCEGRPPGGCGASRGHCAAPLAKAAIFAALGDKDRTFAALDRVVPLGPIRIGREVLIAPGFALLRGDPRLNVCAGRSAYRNKPRRLIPFG